MMHWVQIEKASSFYFLASVHILSGRRGRRSCNGEGEEGGDNDTSNSALDSIFT